MYSSTLLFFNVILHSEHATLRVVLIGIAQNRWIEAHVQMIDFYISNLRFIGNLAALDSKGSYRLCWNPQLKVEKHIFKSVLPKMI